MRWSGMLAQTRRSLRATIAVCLLLVSAVLSFTQLGFVYFSFSGDIGTYVPLAIQPVALASLLCGTLAGTAVGLLAGSVVYVHALLFPLDYYELSYVTPVTSIVLFGAAGLLLGLLFAFMLRNNPPSVRRVVYIALACAIVSFLYSAAFLSNVVASLVAGGFNSQNAYEGIQAVVAAALESGDTSIQAALTAFIMAVLCACGDYVARTLQGHSGAFSIRMVFGSWLAVVIAFSFMFIAAMGFVVATEDERHDAARVMENKLDYLSGQFDKFDKRRKALSELISSGKMDYADLSEEQIESLGSLYEDETLLDGFSVQDDGVIIVCSDDLLYVSNDPHFRTLTSQLKTEGSTGSTEVADVLSRDMVQALEASAETGEIQRFVYSSASVDGAQDVAEDAAEGATGGAAEGAAGDAAEGAAGGAAGDAEGGAAEGAADPTIMYLLAKRVGLGGSTGDLTRTFIIMQSAEQVFAERPFVMMWTTLSALAAMVVALLVISMLLGRVVVRGMNETNDALARVTQGDLEACVKVRETSEFETLSEGINTTVEALKGWIAEAETRMDAELAAARAIQKSALPRTFPPFPEIEKFEIFASMDAAKEVGGDFYDFFLVGDDCNAESGKLGFVMADVSGKGVPAALFMMKAKALLRDSMNSGMELSEAVAQTNLQLCDGNDEDMFVTAWIGVLDYKTGHLDYVNAGHNPPLYRHEGEWSWLKEISGLFLGAYDFPYTAHAMECCEGDAFLLYTDGVTEAMSAEDELYGEDRLLELVESKAMLRPRELLEAVRADVAKHAEGAEQSDDITMLGLELESHAPRPRSCSRT